MTVDDQRSLRDRILEAALSEIRNQGGQGLSLREVARQADVNAATINYHFKSRDGLIQACVESYFLGVREILTALVPLLPTTPFAEIVDRGVRDFLRFGRKNQALARLVLLDFVTRGEMRPEPRTTEDPLVPVAVGYLSGRLGVSEVEIRFRLKSVTLLCGRYLVVGADELVRVSATASPDEAWAALEDHLVGVATQLVCPVADAQ